MYDRYLEPAIKELLLCRLQNTKKVILKSLENYDDVLYIF